MWLKPFSPTSLSSRFFIGLFCLLLFALLALFLIGKLVVLPKILEQEVHQAARELNRLDRVIHTDLKELDTSNRDWATWDDTYAFMLGDEQDYPIRNFSEDMFQDMVYDLMLFIDLDQKVYWSAGIDFNTGNYSSCPGTIDNCAWASPVADQVISLLGDQETAITTLLEQDGHIINTSVQPVLKTGGVGPMTGWLVQLQLLDDNWINRIEMQTSLSLKFDLAEANQNLDLNVTPFSGEHLRAEQHFSGTDLPLKISTNLPRITFLERLVTLRYAQVWTAGLLLAVILLVLWLLDRMILRPLRQLARYTELARSENSGAAPSSGLLERRDEIGELAREFTHLIQQQRMKRTSLENLSLTDHLTGLANRRCFDQKLKALFGQIQHKTQPVAAILFDVDHFKAYNDLYGHQAGDQCLVMLSDCARRVVQDETSSDALLARIGGEEFAVILPGAEEAQAAALAESIRRDIEALALTHEGADRGVVTISCGLSYLEKASNASSSDLLKTADDALYSAKKGGRNLVSKAAVSPLPN